MQINNFFYPVYSLIKDKLITILKNTDKKILMAASIAFSFLTACFVIKSFLSRRVAPIDPTINIKIKFSDDFVFEGNCKKNFDDEILPHGEGVLFYQKKLIYVGEFNEGKPHGKGTIYFPEKSVKGEFYEPFKDLEEIIESNRKNWMIFEGRFEKGMPKRSNDEEVKLISRAERIYQGKLDKAKENNPYFLDGAEGGTVRCTDEIIVKILKAAVNEDKGEIIITYPNQDYYKGQYLLKAEQDEISEGKLIYVLEGNGKKIYANDDVYEGEFMDGVPNGVGKKTYANDDVYEGEFRDGVPHGKGKEIYANGDIYEGEYASGLAIKGTFTCAKY